MNEIMKQILEKIKSYEKIVISRHIRPDGDAVGSTLGLARILTLTYPEKEIIVAADDSSEYLSFLGSVGAPLSAEEHKGALAIVIDTATYDRISNSAIGAATELIKIDHHIPADNYGDIRWVEESRSSACEMIAEFYLAFRDELKADSLAAMYIYMGMVTDSGRFRFSSVTGDTLRCAAALLDIGIDTDTLFSHLYTEEIGELKFRAHITSCVKLTENGVAYLTVTRAMQEKYAISFETASNCVSYISTIKNSIIWLAFIEEDSGEFRVRLRSRFAEISGLAEKYGGGGHACAAGASVKNAREKRALLADADRLIADYKENHEGWL